MTRDLNIHYRACIESFIYLLSTRIALNFAVHKLEFFSSYTGKVHFERLVHLLRYIRDNKTLCLNYYADMNDAPLSDLLRQTNIKTDNQLMVFSNYSWKDCLDTGISTGAYIIFFQGGPIDHGTHVPGPVSQSSAKIQYNAACTAGMALTHFGMLIHELLNKDPDIVPEEEPLSILDIKSAVCMAENGKDAKHTRHIARRVHLVRNKKFTILTGVEEVCNWQTLQLRTLVRMI